MRWERIFGWGWLPILEALANNFWVLPSSLPTLVHIVHTRVVLPIIAVLSVDYYYYFQEQLQLFACNVNATQASLLLAWLESYGKMLSN
jgi:hypothetical protein